MLGAEFVGAEFVRGRDVQHPLKWHDLLSIGHFKLGIPVDVTTLLLLSITKELDLDVNKTRQNTPYAVRREGIKPGTNAWDPGPKSGTKFCQQNIATKHACIKLKFGSNVDYRLFFEMHVSIFLHLPYFYYMQVKYRTMLWNRDPGPTFSVLTMSHNSEFSITKKLILSIN